MKFFWRSTLMNWKIHLLEVDDSPYPVLAFAEFPQTDHNYFLMAHEVYAVRLVKFHLDYAVAHRLMIWWQVPIFFELHDNYMIKWWSQSNFNPNIINHQSLLQKRPQQNRSHWLLFWLIWVQLVLHLPPLYLQEVSPFENQSVIKLRRKHEAFHSEETHEFPVKVHVGAHAQHD